MKKNLEYYRHDCNAHNHPKFKMLRLKYGWEGEGKFWALNNMIGMSEDCRLNIKKGYNKAIVCSELGFTFEEFELYLQYLSKDCKLIIYKSGIITTEMTQENYEKVHGDRTEARKRYERKNKNFGSETTEKIKTSGENSETSGENLYKSNQTKSNQIKLNQTKVNKTKQKEKIPEDGGRDFKISQDQDQKPDQEQLKYFLNGKTEEYFEKFWKFYNRREGKKTEARRIFVEEIKSEDEFKKLLIATRNYNTLTADRELKFLKMPTNFLLTYKDFLKIDN